jgi:hypothetical protein
MKELQFLTNALDAAIKAGVFNLQEAGQILQAINALGSALQQSEAKNTPIDAPKEVLPTEKPKAKK